MALAGLLAASSAWAQGVPEAVPLVGATEIYDFDETSGLALAGFDPVTYFLPEGPKPGRPELELVWSGVAWRFASQANRAAFAADPTAFAPRIGGYDAQAASLGRVVDGDPGLYLIRDGRLYLFRSDATRARFLADGSIAAKSEERWALLKTGLVQR